MPFVEAGDLRVHYELSGPAAAPALVFSNSLGSDLSMWEPQMPAFEAKFRVLRYDTRGHGRTAVPPGPYTIERLARDVVALLDTFGIERAHFCGLSMGGKIGMWLGAYAPERIARLALCNTGARIGTAERWNGRIEEVRRGGMAAIAAGVAERWFTKHFCETAPATVARARAMVERTPPAGYVANCEAIRDGDETPLLGMIHAPTLVISGTHDPATPPADGRLIAGRIAGARYVELNASHLSNVEAAEAFTSELGRFLAG